MNSSHRALATPFAILALAALLAAEIVRLTVSNSVVDNKPALASRLAPSSPAVLAFRGMAGVGVAAAQGREIDPSTSSALRSLARSDPLRAEPFLVAGAIAEREGSYEKAKKLLAQARSRDPRSVAGRYLYADTALRQGDILGGLQEMAVLSRLLPGAAMQLVPALAEFAQTPGARQKLAGILSQNPQLKNPLLLALAADPENTNLVLWLAGPANVQSNSNSRVWQARLLQAIVAQGDYSRAHTLWRRFARIPDTDRSLLNNGSFQQIAAPPPFNWDLSPSSAGVAESGKQGLSVLYYGRADTVLASQLLLLSPGTYRLETPVRGDIVTGALSWTISCIRGGQPLLDLKLAQSPAPSGTFAVPSASCPAQILRLNGHSQESPQDSDFKIGSARIERIGG